MTRPNRCKLLALLLSYLIIEAGALVKGHHDKKRNPCNKQKTTTMQ